MNIIKKESHQGSIIARKDFLSTIAITLILSWIYALCAQISIPLPFNLVPISIHPVPIFICVHYFGWTAISAYGAYLLQGACGAPFFAQAHGGLMRLLGPTGGYLWGFLLAAIFIKLSYAYHKKSWITNIPRFWIAAGIYFGCGLFQLSWFVPSATLYACGLYPFIIGDFILKPLLYIVGITHKKR